MTAPWLTAKELAGLPGMVSSERRTRDRLLQLGVASRPRVGRGGGREFDCGALPAETRQALMIASVTTAGREIAALTEANTAAPVPAVIPTDAGRKPPSQDQKAVADARMILVNQVVALAETAGTLQATLLLAQQLASGECSADLAVAARTANLRARGDAVSNRSLFRWLATYQKDGWWGLLPTPTNPAVSSNADDVAAVIGKYLSRDPQFRNLSHAAQEVTKALGREYDTWRQLYDRSRRALTKVDRTTLIKARHSGAERAAKLPFKRRDTSVLRPLDVWLIDGHTFKAKVRHPDHGAPFAPEVTIVIDAATRRICGWSVALSENVIAVGDALRHAVTQVGVPAIIYSDNGAGETAKQMDCPVTGIVARLGSEHRTGIPGHPQGHGLIERSWRTHMIKCARKFGSYQGKDVDSRTLRNVSRELASEQRAVKRAAEGSGEVIQLSPKAPSWQQFVDEVDAQVREYNATHRHRSLPKNAQGKHLTPDEAWAAWINPEDQHIPSPLEARMLFMPATLRTAKRGEVAFLNQVYFSHDLMQVDGQQVRVHYDIHDPAFVLVFDLAGQFVCEAKWNANRIDYFPKPVVDMAREKRVRGIVKRKTDQIELAQRELAGTTTLSLPEPTAPVVVGLINPAVPLSSQPVLDMAQRAQAAAGRPFFDAPSARYEWLMVHRNEWTDDDAAWTAGYVRGDDYAELRDYYAGRGLDWKDGEAGIESAR